MNDVEFENIADDETKECIAVFHAEMNSLLNKTHECGSVEIGKYARIEENDSAKIAMEFSCQGKTVALTFHSDYFEDYCYCTRKERNTLLKNTLEEIKDKIAAL